MCGHLAVYNCVIVTKRHDLHFIIVEQNICLLHNKSEDMKSMLKTITYNINTKSLKMLLLRHFLTFHWQRQKKHMLSIVYNSAHDFWLAVLIAFNVTIWLNHNYTSNSTYHMRKLQLNGNCSYSITSYTQNAVILLAFHIPGNLNCNYYDEHHYNWHANASDQS